jgi:3-isopropylmalate/(R)-2-methylmalate dehydratase small subunit
MTMTRVFDARARVLGDDINTDYIIASIRKRETLDESVLKRYLLEAIDPAFASSVQPGDVLVAGKNFGCGSAMEVAATVIVAAGIQAVLAKSFSRTFYRNAINNGLTPLQCDTSGIHERHALEIACGADRSTVTNRSTGVTVDGLAMPSIMLDILGMGGLVEYVKRYGRIGNDS